MELRPIDDWDGSYLDAVAASDETAWLEKKAELEWDPQSNAGKAKLQEEIAKQVSAFSNAGEGFLVFGVDDKSKTLDQGILPEVGRQSAEDWVEAYIPKLLSPPVTGCQARLIRRQGHHQNGRGLLVIHVPLSEARPHLFARNEGDVAYIRAGAHSHPMRFQTVLDIAGRQAAHQAEIVSLGVLKEPQQPPPGGFTTVRINPVIRLVAGVVCEHWAVDLTLLQERDHFTNITNSAANAQMISPRNVSLNGHTPLIRGRPTRAVAGSLLVNALSLGDMVRVSLFAGPKPVTKELCFLFPGDFDETSSPE
jgi:hypothetical protein